MQTSLGWSPSYAWRSILHGCELLEQGLRWSIGDDLTCHISEAFIPSNPKFKTITPITGEDSLVANFISDERTWRMDSLAEVVWSIDANAIASIPLPATARSHRLVWNYSGNGIFSVSSAFDLAMRETLSGQNTSSVEVNKKFWEHLWNMPIPKKVSHFIWKLFYDILPTSDNLIRRNILVSPTCCLCSKGSESIHHLFTVCKSSVDRNYSLSLEFF